LVLINYGKIHFYLLNSLPIPFWVCRYFRNHYLCSPELEALSAYKLRITGLGLGFHTFDYEIGASFFAAFPGSQLTDGKLSLVLEVEKKTSSLILQFRIRGEIVLPCDRCLADVPVKIDTHAKLVLRMSTTPGKPDDDLVWLPITAYEYDFAPYLYETIHLQLPLKVSCDLGQNKGCQADFENLLSKYSGATAEEAAEEERADEAPVDPRWEKLKNLKF